LNKTSLFEESIASCAADSKAMTNRIEPCQIRLVPKWAGFDPGGLGSRSSEAAIMAGLLNNKSGSLILLF
jgi:hypothetical protein